MNKKKYKKVLVVLGGTSGERAVSLQSGKACAKALKKRKYAVSTFDPKKRDYNSITNKKIDVIFNALHGKNGEDGIAQSHFEFLGIPYTHSGIISSYNSMNKIISKKIFLKNKILTPKYFVLEKKNFNNQSLRNFLRRKKINFPVVVKPTNEGSSLGVKISKSNLHLTKITRLLFKKYDKLLYEEYIGGQEVQVAVLNNKSLGAIELVPKRDFYDYKAKYNRTAKTEHLMPARIKSDKYKEVLRIAKKAHDVLGCRGVTRSDFKFFKNKFYLLELNTQPGMTSLSLVPEIANYCGIDFPKLVEKILQDASLNK